jgi:hypothetical protein
MLPVNGPRRKSYTIFRGARKTMTTAIGGPSWKRAGFLGSTRRRSGVADLWLRWPAIRLAGDGSRGKLGHGGTGGTGHSAGFFFQRQTGTRFQFVPYRGAALAIQDLVAGQIDIASTDAISALAQVRAGTIKAFGVTTKTRVPSAPDIPTLDEAGLPGFDISQWHGLWLPKGTPKPQPSDGPAWAVRICNSANECPRGHPWPARSSRSWSIHLPNRSRGLSSSSRNAPSPRAFAFRPWPGP